MSNTSSALGCSPSADGAFGPIVQSCRDDFDFTIAFEQYFFTIGPAAILLVAAAPRLRYLSRLPTTIAGTSLKLTKLVAIAVFAILQLALVVVWAKQSAQLGNIRTVSVAASCISFIASLVFCALSYVEHHKSLRPSFILNAYLLVSLVLDGAILRTFWLAAVSPPIRGIFTASFTLKTVILVLEAIEKRRFIILNVGQSSPETTSGLYSQGFLWWMNPLLLNGYRRLLKPVDLYTLERGLSTAVMNERFWHSWTHSRSQGKNSLIHVCVKTLGWPFLSAVIPRLFLLAFTICQPIVLNQLLSFLEDPSESLKNGYGLMAAYGLVYLGIAVSSAFYWHRANRMLAMLRGMLMSAIFAKSTEISITATDNDAAVTLMSTDVDVIIAAVTEIHEFWASILQIGLATWLLSNQIGFACVGPVVVCFLALLATMLVTPFSKKYMLAWVQKVQKRIGIISTMLGHMKSIKMSGLSRKLSDTIGNLRIEEINAATPFRILLAVNSAISQIPQMISPVAAFAFFTIRALRSGETLDVTRIFVSLSLIILLSAPLFSMLHFVLEINAAFGCFARIEKFLSMDARTDSRIIKGASTESLQTDTSGSKTQLTPGIEDCELQTLERSTHILRPIPEPETNATIIDIQNASFSWSAEGEPVLKEVDLAIEKGQLAMIIGPVASGKSTLLKGLLGEVPIATGQARLLGSRLSWCEQSTWLINGSVKNNILGFSKFEPELYQRVIYACDLEKDFARLQNGDETVTGSKGIALSGGQKQRVAIARALYSRPQIAIFDDVFNGLDKQTAETVFTRVFSKNAGLLRKWGTTAVLATHAVSLLPSSDLIIALHDGTVIEKGTFEALVNNDGYTKSIYGEHKHDLDEDTSSSFDPIKDSQAKKSAPKETDAAEDIRRQTGDFTVYRFFFFDNVGLALSLILLAGEIIWAFLSTFPTVWLMWWSNGNAEEPNQRIGYYLGGYAGLQVAAVLSFGILVWLAIAIVAAKSGIRLHQVLLRTVTRAPLSLFTNTDIGSITTRFSQDIGLLDRNLPLALLITLADLFTAVAQAILIASATFYIALSFPFLIVVFYYLQKGYLRTSRQLRFLDLEEKAPVYTQFLETLGGLATIRAFGWGKAAIEQSHRLVDRAQKPFYLLLMVQQWLRLVLDLTVAALSLLVVGLAVKLRDSTSVGLTGVSLIQLISFSETLKILIQFWTSLETSIGAVARIKHFSEGTPEENLPGENQAPPPAWPSSGDIQIEGISASYVEGLDVEGLNVKALDAITLSVRAGEKIGVCGRTGSGKSSFLLALLRMLDLSSGSIRVDGIDLSTLPREEVRSRIIAVTQDSFFLPGTVRLNINPYEASVGEAIADVLRKVGLWEVIQEKGGLDKDFEEDMLSHGQKQLFSLARAILRKGIGNVVLLDEATSSVDRQTDALMQQLIHDEFRDHTVISIAHRLETIAGFDRVVVLEKGCVVEVGQPQELLKSVKSKFRDLWEGSRRTRNAGSGS